jgi:tetratricopeptide (TPR) repeat protein
MTNPVAPAATSTRFILAVCLLLAAATLAIYARTFGHGFVSYDDDLYVYLNPTVKAGLSAKNIVWAFTTFYFANWHPLTWLSYMLDIQLFGFKAGPEHVVNVVFHIGAAVLLFLAFLRMTRQAWPSAFVAGIFALHPLHVESVAWIAERKDVLSTFFQMLTLLLYAGYARKPSIGKYAGVALAFALSLLAKPMAVTFPFVLLLLDVWPLRRIDPTSWRERLPRLLGEKAPLIAMSAATSALTFLAQRSAQAVATLTLVPFPRRFANAAISYISYMGKALWPADLGVLYPLRHPTFEAAAAAVLTLAAITVAAVLTFRKRPYLLVGWLWYVGMLVPVIGLVQVGSQSMADRYTYVPMVGLSIAVIWALDEALQGRPFLRRGAAALGLLALLAFAAAAYRQAGYWKDSKTLFEHTLAVTDENVVIENNLGVVLQGEGKHAEAMALYRRAVAWSHDYADAHANLGHELLYGGQYAEASAELSEALRLSADSAKPQGDMGLLLAVKGDFAAARQHLEKSLARDSESAEVESNYCWVLLQLGQPAQAIAACDAALKINPDFVDARFNRGNALAAKGQPEAAAAEFSRVLAVNPNYAAARAALAGIRPGPPNGEPAGHR